MTNPLYQMFGSRVRALREQRNFTQEELGRRVDLSRTSIVNIEKGRQRVLLHQVVEIASALDAKPSELLPKAPSAATHSPLRQDVALLIETLEAEGKAGLMQPRVNYALVRRRARELIADQVGPPVDLERVAAMLDAEIRPLEVANDISGILYRDGDRRVVVVNAAHSNVRQRFTIAHELGHLALHRGHKVHVDHEFRINLRDRLSATAENVEEVEANAFAANLLMPAEWIWRELDAVPIDPGDEGQVIELAGRLGVSQQAIFIRIASLAQMRAGPAKTRPEAKFSR